MFFSAVLIDSYACLTKDKGAREAEYRCMDRFVRQMELIRDRVDGPWQFQSYCCSYQEFDNCVIDLVNYECNERLGLKTADFVQHKLVSMRKSFADIGNCDRLCDDVPANVTDLLGRITRDPEVKPEVASPTLIFMDIATAHAKGRRFG